MAPQEHCKATVSTFSIPIFVPRRSENIKQGKNAWALTTTSNPGDSCTLTFVAFSVNLLGPKLASSLVTLVLIGASSHVMSACKSKSKSVAPAPASSKNKPASLVLHNATVITVDRNNPRASAVAIQGDRIVFVGNSQEVQAWIGPSTQVIDMNAQMVMPGFVEGHAHFLSIGESRLRLRLQDTKNWSEIVAMVKAATKTIPKGQWIVGRGWHQAKWSKKPSPDLDGLPYHDELSAVSPDHPVLLIHASGHASFANAKAMELGGVTASTSNPPGGEIVRDSRGRAIGVFRETASDLVSPKKLTRNPELQRKKAMLAAQECLEKGITSFQDAGTDAQDIAMLKELSEQDALGPRLWVMLSGSIPNEELETLMPKLKFRDEINHRFAVGGVKRFIDGALGSHGAWLLQPYTDLPTSSGLAVESLDSLRKTAELAKKHGYQLCTHAIGDRGNREMLNIYESVLGPEAKSSDHRWRIEHAQHLNPSDVPRFAKLGVIASMQSVHCTSDGPWVPKRLGMKRAEQTSYLWRSLLDAGVVVSNGTDAPVEDVDPLASYYAAVSRRLADGSEFFPEQRMTRQEALRSYTLDAAYAAFEEKLKGSLRPGKLADITVLSDDITTIDADKIPDVNVMMTIVGGKVRYRRPGSPLPNPDSPQNQRGLARPTGGA